MTVVLTTRARLLAEVSGASPLSWVLRPWQRTFTEEEWLEILAKDPAHDLATRSTSVPCQAVPPLHQ